MTTAEIPVNTPHQDRVLLDELIGIAAGFIRDMRDLPQLIGQDRVRDYDILMRSIRRSMLLKPMLLKLDLAADPATARREHRTAARQRIVREVQDAIQHHAPAHAETLQNELLDRLEEPEFDAELDTRPAADLIADIIHDMHLVPRFEATRFARRTPEDVTRLRTLAAHPTATSTHPRSAQPLSAQSISAQSISAQSRPNHLPANPHPIDDAPPNRPKPLPEDPAQAVATILRHDRARQNHDRPDHDRPDHDRPNHDRPHHDRL